MLRTTVKIILYTIVSLDIIYCLTVSPQMAITKAIFMVATVWAWKLY